MGNKHNLYVLVTFCFLFENPSGFYPCTTMALRILHAKRVNTGEPLQGPPGASFKKVLRILKFVNCMGCACFCYSIGQYETSITKQWHWWTKKVILYIYILIFTAVCPWFFKKFQNFQANAPKCKCFGKHMVHRGTVAPKAGQLL